MPDISFNPLARQQGCATKYWNSFSGRLPSCFNPLARQQGCATILYLLKEEKPLWFQSSCEATGLRNHLRLLTDVSSAGDGFNPLARQQGCATSSEPTSQMHFAQGFNPLARQQGCATKKQHDRTTQKTAVSILLRGNRVAQPKSRKRSLKRFVAVSILLRGNRVAQPKP